MVTRSKDCPSNDVCLRDGKGTVNVKDLTDKQGLYNHGRLFAHVTIEPGHSIGDHPHVNETEFYYIIKGEGVFNDNGTEVIVHAGDICATGFGEVHGIENKSTEMLELIALIVLDN
ncbi:MAG: cupin domain-containing protein [Oscillibacter sp.]|nr:cupin domain-containing protein [Oscillibacter sp.]